MAGMDGPVDRAFLVSVEDLRDICDALTDEKHEYKLTCEDEKKVAIFYNDGPDDLNAVCFTFPVIVDIWTLGILARTEEAGLMVCLHVYLQKQTRKGLYPVGDKLFWDSLEDWKSSGDRWKRRWPRGWSARVRGRLTGARARARTQVR